MGWCQWLMGKTPTCQGWFPSCRARSYLTFKVAVHYSFSTSASAPKNAQSTLTEVHTVLKHSEDAQSQNRVTQQCCTPSITIQGAGHNQRYAVTPFGCLTCSSLLSKFLQRLHSRICWLQSCKKWTEPQLHLVNRIKQKELFTTFAGPASTLKAAQQRKLSYHKGRSLCCR